MDKLPKSEAWKQSDPDRLRLLLHPRYSSRASALELQGGLAELPHLSNLEPRNPIGSRRILEELLRSSYKEVSRLAERSSVPQILATLLTRLCLATTLRMGALQVESPKYGVCSNFHR
jgi:hypothetical protein